MTDRIFNPKELVNDSSLIAQSIEYYIEETSMDTIASGERDHLSDWDPTALEVHTRKYDSVNTLLSCDHFRT